MANRGLCFDCKQVFPVAEGPPGEKPCCPKGHPLIPLLPEAERPRIPDAGPPLLWQPFQVPPPTPKEFLLRTVLEPPERQDTTK